MLVAPTNRVRGDVFPRESSEAAAAFSWNSLKSRRFRSEGASDGQLGFTNCPKLPRSVQIDASEARISLHCVTAAIGPSLGNGATRSCSWNTWTICGVVCGATPQFTSSATTPPSTKAELCSNTSTAGAIASKFTSCRSMRRRPTPWSESDGTSTKRLPATIVAKAWKSCLTRPTIGSDTPAATTPRCETSFLSLPSAPVSRRFYLEASSYFLQLEVSQ